MNNHHPKTAKFPPREVVQNVRALKDDAFNLVRLQAELFRTDVKDCAQQVRRPATLLIVALVVAVGCVPVALVGLALAMTAVAEVSLAASLVIVALVTLALSAVAAVYAWRRLHAATTVFDRSQTEFKRNVSWLKELLNREEHL